MTSQFIVAGNIRDIHLVRKSADSAAHVLTTSEVIVGLLIRRRYDLVYSYDPVDGIRLEYHGTEVDPESFFSSTHLGRATASTTGRLADLIRNARAPGAPRVAVVIAYASRLWAEEPHAGPDLRGLFAAAEKRANSNDGEDQLRNNPGRFDCGIFWLADEAQDAPQWLSRASGVRLVHIPLPSLGLRKSGAGLFLRRMDDPARTDAAAASAAETVLADLSQGMTLREIDSVVTLAIEQGIDITRIDEALRSYRLGVLESPWGDPLLLQRLKRGTDSIGRRVLGQPRAIQQALTVLTRSAMGLTGAHVGNASGRPQGILFFAGPTGVGKTELAKALAETLFGAEDAYIRFDMSEFSAEHSEARLIGAPPGYVGHSAGGELTNAVRDRPFSILLFDEIEKAHPRILDKFLQILEDGRLTDGSGETVYFSETVIVFTSNLGTYRSSSEAGASDNFARWGDPYRDTEAKVRRAIEVHFTEQLQRPELLSRIGDNIVVFDFISEAVARELVRKYLSAVIRRVQTRHGITLRILPDVSNTIEENAVENLAFGGRGVGSIVETLFVNPLTRALISAEKSAQALAASQLTRLESSWELRLTSSDDNQPFTSKHF
ncbi:energy-coupling factor transporter ATP-binding protein EcfA2 [Arthrobacter sp. PvP023]|uniref:AAA family ATPase n=1 Tax=Arthrobacter sp. PvP023 TaxID=2806585 RepID=UPI001B5D8A3B|nr:AAA family ATPase [Arthrobacter sp. PvP023]MBP1136646.1 energy-coupling factor transporter ATP-binding protein EcfA2 [Arthrobacter sp. PvP023]